MKWFIVNLTNRCNLNCKTCLRGEKSDADLDIGILKQFLKYAKEYRIKGISLTGGEPILHPNFKEVIHNIISHKFKLSLVTNGIFYKDYLKILRKYKSKIKRINLSLDSHKEEINDYIRGPGTYKKILEAIHYLQKENIPLALTHVINNQNFRDLEKFITFAINLGIKKIRLLGLIYTKENKNLTLNPSQKKELLIILNRSRKKSKNLIFYTSLGFSNNLIFCSNLRRTRRLTLNYNGDLIFCCDTPYEGVVVGNLKNQSFRDLLTLHTKMRNKIISERVRYILSGNTGSFNDCNFCIQVLKHFSKNLNNN